MLIGFKVKNFKSFRDLQHFSLFLDNNKFNFLDNIIST